MSTSDGGSRAAELAAQQVEAIVQAAETAAKDIEADAERRIAAHQAQLDAEYASRKQALEEEIGKIRREALHRAERERTEAQEYAAGERNAAEAEVKRLRDQARRDAQERVAAAEKAADEALSDARAISAGLRGLGQSLEEHAERILREVTAGHRRLRGDLRIASGGSATEAPRRATPPSSSSSSSSSSASSASSPSQRPASRPPREDRPARRGTPFDDIDVPDWVARDE
jgi:cell division septum initiation protein DivIVA